MRPTKAASKSGKEPKFSRTQAPTGVVPMEWQRALRRQFGHEQVFGLDNIGTQPFFSDYAGDGFCKIANYVLCWRKTKFLSDQGRRRLSAGGFFPVIVGICALTFSFVLGGCATNAGAMPAGSAGVDGRLAPVASRVLDVKGADNVTLKVYEFGNPDGRPIVFIHGINQAHAVWHKQLGSDLANHYRLVAFDLRGHGFSDKPAEMASYRAEKSWADDLNAVIVSLKLNKPVLVGWSFGGRIVAMYLRHYGAGNVGAIDFVGTVLRVARDASAQRSPQLSAAVGNIMRAKSIQDYTEGQRAFVRAMSHSALPNDEFERILAFNMHVPRHVFKAVVTAGDFDYEPELRTLRVPTLVTHGRFDLVSNIGNGRFVAERVAGARLSIFEEAGHLAFWEMPTRFNDELDALAQAASR